MDFCRAQEIKKNDSAAPSSDFFADTQISLQMLEYGIKRYKTNPHSQPDVGRSEETLRQVQPRLLSHEQAISRKGPLLRVALEMNSVKSMASRGVNGMYIFVKM